MSSKAIEVRFLSPPDIPLTNTPPTSTSKHFSTLIPKHFSTLIPDIDDQSDSFLIQSRNSVLN